MHKTLYYTKMATTELEEHNVLVEMLLVVKMVLVDLNLGHIAILLLIDVFLVFPAHSGTCFHFLLFLHLKMQD